MLEDQAQFDPMDFLRALAAQLREHGGTLHQGRRVTGVSRTGAPEVELEDGTTLRAEHVVLATGVPILDRGLYFSKVEPERSYALAFDSAAAPEGMYLSAGSDSRSIRDAPVDGGTRLLVGGAGHSVGRTRSELQHVDRLREWTATYFPGAVETHQWSAQDYSPHDGVPFVGLLPRGLGRIYVATGFDKWGMTNGVAAARAISGPDPGRGAVLGQADEPAVDRPVRGGPPGDDQREGRAGCWRVGGRRRAERAAVRGRRSLHAPRRPAALERRRELLGLPAARVAVRPGRVGPGGSCDPAARPPLEGSLSGTLAPVGGTA